MNPTTGAIKWGFQYTPNDPYDFDEISEHPIINAKVNGEDRKLVLHTARNGFFYALDRTNGSFVHGKQYVDKLTWTTGLDPKTGKPLNYDPTKDVQEYSKGSHGSRENPRGITDKTLDGIVAIVPNLRALDLSGNPITIAGAMRILQARNPDVMETLYLNSYQPYKIPAKEEGADEFAIALAANLGRLYGLRMPKGMSNAGVDALAKALEDNDKLIEFNIGDSIITSSKALVTMLRKNKQLKNVWVNITELPMQERLELFAASQSKTCKVRPVVDRGTMAPWPEIKDPEFGHQYFDAHYPDVYNTRDASS